MCIVYVLFLSMFNPRQAVNKLKLVQQVTFNKYKNKLQNQGKIKQFNNGKYIKNTLQKWIQKEGAKRLKKFIKKQKV